MEMTTFALDPATAHLASDYEQALDYAHYGLNMAGDEAAGFADQYDRRSSELAGMRPSEFWMHGVRARVAARALQRSVAPV